MIKKIDSEILGKMIAEGKPQKEMALFFGVSEAAISKRIKRLKRPDTPDSFKKLTLGEKRFVLAKIEGKSGTASALEAFNCGSVQSAKAIGSRLSNDPDIRIAINDLMHQEGIGRRMRTRRLRDVIQAQDLGIAAKGLDMANRLTGEYAPDKIDINNQHSQTLALIEYIRASDEYRKEEKETLESYAEADAFSESITGSNI
jgi:phage terminase small subunit